MAKLETKHVIDDVIVEHFCELKASTGAVNVFIKGKVDESITFCFVDKGNNLIGEIAVEADMAQGMGYIADYKYRKDGV